MKHTRILALAASAALLLPSCVSTKNVPLSANDRAAIRGKSVMASKRNMPPFGVMTPGAMAASSVGILGGAVGGGIVGGIVGGVAQEKGRKQIVAHGIPVPEDAISRDLVKQMTFRHGMKALPTPQDPVRDEKPETIAAQYGKADYILDVCTTGWGGGYYPMNFSKYFISYSAKMRLIDTKTGRVIAEGFHSYQGKDKQNAPDHDGIYANGASFLRSETKKGTDGATTAFQAQLQ
jgi:hypothetical protein